MTSKGLEGSGRVDTVFRETLAETEDTRVTDTELELDLTYRGTEALREVTGSCSIHSKSLG